MKPKEAKGEGGGRKEVVGVVVEEEEDIDVEAEEVNDVRVQPSDRARCLASSTDLVLHWVLVAGLLIVGYVAVTQLVYPRHEERIVVMGQLDSAGLEISPFVFKRVSVRVKARSSGNVSIGLISKASRRASQSQITGSVFDHVAFGANGYLVSEPLYIRGGAGASGVLNITAAFNGSVETVVLAGYQSLSDWIQHYSFGSAPPTAAAVVFASNLSSVSASISIKRTSFYYIVWSVEQPGTTAIGGWSVANYSYFYHKLPANQSSLCLVNSTCSFTVESGRNILLVNSGPLPGNATDALKVRLSPNMSMFTVAIVLPLLFVSLLLAWWLWLKSVCPLASIWLERSYQLEAQEEQEEYSSDSETEKTSLMTKKK